MHNYGRWARQKHDRARDLGTKLRLFGRQAHRIPAPVAESVSPINACLLDV
ncbi:MAG: hypothetical protein HY267_03165 [Deltaproteobacteria bacterium]|nr:hypothetical protein [Deltaproteobacteria bacterium]